MIEYVKGNILDDDSDLLVIPVNCVGTMGAGLAKQFKDRWPHLDELYQKALRTTTLYYLHPHIDRMALGASPERGVVFFPTKFHYKDKSKPQDIWWTLGNLQLYRHTHYQKTTYGMRDDESIAFPKIGCGLGGLQWEEVEQFVKDWHTSYAPWVRLRVYE